MKKISFLILCLTTVLTISSCSSGKDITNPNETIAISDETTVSSEKSSLTETKTQFLYKNVEIMENSGTGVLSTYEDMQDIIGLYSDKINFVRYEIIEKCTLEEAKKFVGLDENGTTLYKAKIDYDYLNDEAVDKIIYLAKAGNEKIQSKNQPLPDIGDKYAGMIMNLKYDSWNVALPELSFAIVEDGNEERLYQIKFDFMKLSDENDNSLGKAVSDDLMYRYTTTDNNPVKYVREYTVDELTNFFRKDWAERGYKIRKLDDKVFDTNTMGYTYNEDDDIIPVAERKEDINE